LKLTLELQALIKAGKRRANEIESKVLAELSPLTAKVVRQWLSDVARILSYGFKQCPYLPTKLLHDSNSRTGMAKTFIF
jgi:hypothetical protein